MHYTSVHLLNLMLMNIGQKSELNFSVLLNFAAEKKWRSQNKVQCLEKGYARGCQEIICKHSGGTRGKHTTYKTLLIVDIISGQI